MKERKNDVIETLAQQNEHMTNELTNVPENKNPELNCDDCDFQSNTGPELKKHVSSTHHRAARGLSEGDLGETLRCNICKE